MADFVFTVGGVSGVGGNVPEDAPVFVISVAAQLAGMHAQTLRQYDRLGLVSPGRTGGGGRRYSARDVAVLREVQRLSQDEGVNLAGIKRIIVPERNRADLEEVPKEVVDELQFFFVSRMEQVLEAVLVLGHEIGPGAGSPIVPVDAQDRPAVDVDVLELYDPFSFEIIRQLEAFRFCPDGESQMPQRAGRLRPVRGLRVRLRVAVHHGRAGRRDRGLDPAAVCRRP